MLRNTLVWLLLQSRRALVSRHHVLSPTLMVLHFAAVTPACHYKEIDVLDLSPKAAFPKFKDSCVELMNRPCRKQSNHVGGNKGWEAGGMWLALFSHL